jgi:hypothetical protein
MKTPPPVKISVSEAAAALGKLGGSVTSARKAAAARRNGRKNKGKK